VFGEGNILLFIYAAQEAGMITTSFPYDRFKKIAAQTG
jgi:hypothetical protein